jgi:glycosyltransferase involved in cell wall biosynthesis
MKYSLDDIVVITPLYNEANNLHTLLDSIQQAGLKKLIFGVSPKSTDDTKLILDKESISYAIPQKDGYDFAVEAALDKIDSLFPGIRLVLFAEAHQKYSSSVLGKFLDQLNEGADLVMGIQKKDANSKEWYKTIGSKMIIFPLQIFFRRKIRDISPFRLIKRELISQFQLEPKRFRWPTEMIVKSLAMNLKIIELPIELPRHAQDEKIDLAETINRNVDSLSALQFINYHPPQIKES